ncbi:MAG: carboxypeptidase-like regulatory domain-containing protein [Muribaculaceae bacterium]|nr:carboxypeptidase-like regulatory domain-containing protein [Muribaculaceae bacterium]
MKKIVLIMLLLLVVIPLGAKNVVSISDSNKVLTGLVTDKEHKAVAGAKVMLVAPNNGYGSVVETKSDGTFLIDSINLPKGAVAVAKAISEDGEGQLFI